MRRISMTPRPDWRTKCEEAGFSFHSLPSEGGLPYWREDATYVLSMNEVEQLEAETAELFARCMDAVEHCIDSKRFAEFGIPEAFWPAIRQSWDQDDPTVYGRFDLACRPGQSSKLLEFNADTPTSLIESSVVQWFWMKDHFGDSKDQFNSLHEQLIEQWRHIRQERWKLPEGTLLHMASLHDAGDGKLLIEDYDNVLYMAQTARAAGFNPKHIFVEQIGWNDKTKIFTDADGLAIRQIFKLYPWEWMIHENYAGHILEAGYNTRWIEPSWKMLLSNKQLLVVLWELFPDHPLLLPAFNSDVPFDGRRHVRKPKLGREGANVQIVDAAGRTEEAAEGGYGDEGYVWQEYCPLPSSDGWNSVLGSWIVGDTPAGIDFRETSTRITGDMAFFVPHYIDM